ncbi:nascent polypeptide-associated complex subunit alpha [Drosophila takahashii]|uniref:nascent polypeptide-associated complex subunit alpha n=1 Tax=Drosophila takahashii TaxID=29030 RepID=UPI001CF8C1A9|nr:nascent polypeptide-associated complex subunit alpha [Drosophila takahashii]
MGKKQKLKKAAQMAATATAAAAKLQKDDKENSPRGEPSAAPGCSGGQKEKPCSREQLDPGYCKKLKKLMDLANQLPTKVMKLQQSAEEQQAASVEDSSGGGESTDSDDEAPDLVELERKASQLGQLSPLTLRSADGPKHSRGEKKARRMLMKLDLKPVANVTRVTMRKNKNIMLYIQHPEVFKVPHSETYICFGEVRVEDISSSAAASQAAAKAAERFRVPTPGGGEEGATPAGESLADEEEDDDEEVNDANLDEKDIELVQMQAACSRKTAIKALLRNDNDVVNAIMALTVG